MCLAVEKRIKDGSDFDNLAFGYIFHDIAVYRFDVHHDRKMSKTAVPPFPLIVYH